MTQISKNSELLLTTTNISAPGNLLPAGVHLWHISTNTELLPPIPIFNNIESHSNMDFAQQILTVRTQSGSSSWDSPIQYITYQWDLSVDPNLVVEDPRLDIVIRTGTYLDSFGTVTFLPRAVWKKLKDNPVRPAYEDWLHSVENPVSVVSERPSRVVPNRSATSIVGDRLPGKRRMKQERSQDQREGGPANAANELSESSQPPAKTPSLESQATRTPQD